MASLEQDSTKLLYTCPVPHCRKTFSRREYVTRHARLAHESVRPFQCSICQSRFARSDVLHRHEKTCSVKSSKDKLQEERPASSFPSNTIGGVPGPSFTPFTSANDTLPHNTLPPLNSYQQVGSSSSRSSGDISVLELQAPVASSSRVTTEQQLLSFDVFQDHRSLPTLSLPPIPSSTNDPSPFLSAAEDLSSTISTQQTVVHPDSSSAAASDAAMLLADWNATSGSIEVDSRLENSPEALALADYFNKGGVGGITALELGFTPQLSMYRPELFEPQPIAHTDVQKKWHLPKGKICQAFVYSWRVPPVHRLSEFAQVASNNLLTTVPVLHGPSINLTDMPANTAFALSVAGAAYETDGEKFSNEMLVEKRVFLIKEFNLAGSSFEDQFATLQSLLLYQLIGIFHKEQSQRFLSSTFHSSLVMMLQQLQLPLKIQQTNLPPPDPSLTDAELDAAWKAWIALETQRRVCFIVFLTDVEMASTFDSPLLLPLSDLAIDLPCSEALWNAPDAQTWLRTYHQPQLSTSVSFVEAVRVLMLAEEPEPLSSDGVLLNALKSLGSLPLMVLSRTLTFLAKKTEETLKQADPFRTMMDGFHMFEDRGKESREILRRIDRGRDFLRKLPGGVSRGNGEGWFEAAMPKPKTSTSPSSSGPNPASSVQLRPSESSQDGSDELRKRDRAVEREREYDDWTVRLTKRRAEDARERWPDFMPQVSRAEG